MQFVFQIKCLSDWSHWRVEMVLFLVCLFFFWTRVCWLLSLLNVLVYNFWCLQKTQWVASNLGLKKLIRFEIFCSCSKRQEQTENERVCIKAMGLSDRWPSKFVKHCIQLKKKILKCIVLLFRQHTHTQLNSPLLQQIDLCFSSRCLPTLKNKRLFPVRVTLSNEITLNQVVICGAAPVSSWAVRE